MKKTTEWIDEDTAMKILGYKKSSLRIFTRDPKRKKLPIRTVKLQSKKILYSKTDIEDFIHELNIKKVQAFLLH